MLGMFVSFRRGGGRKYSRLPRRRGGLHRRGHDGPGPRARLSQRAGAHDLAPSYVQSERRLGSDSGAGIRLGAVVVDTKLGELRKEADQVETAAVVAGADVPCGNVVPAPCDPYPHPRDVQLRAFETDVPHAHGDSRGKRALEQCRDRGAAERRLERERLALGDGPLEQTTALMPCGAVRLGLAEATVAVADQPRGLVGVEVLRAGVEKGGAGEAARTGAVRPR